jgi:hypothetical protein
MLGKLGALERRDEPEDTVLVLMSDTVEPASLEADAPRLCCCSVGRSRAPSLFLRRRLRSFFALSRSTSAMPQNMAARPGEGPAHTTRRPPPLPWSVVYRNTLAAGNGARSRETPAVPRAGEVSPATNPAGTPEKQGGARCSERGAHAGYDRRSGGVLQGPARCCRGAAVIRRCLLSWMSGIVATTGTTYTRSGARAPAE